MEIQQNSTPAEKTESVNESSVELVNGVTVAQDEYIAYVALGGLIPDPDGVVAGKKLSATKLAERLGVDRTTLYYWRSSIPDFWDRVAAKRKQLAGRDRISTVWNGVYLRAATGDPQAAKLFLKNFDENYVDPLQKIEHEVGNSWAALIQQKRANAAAANNVIDGETVDETPGN